MNKHKRWSMAAARVLAVTLGVWLWSATFLFPHSTAQFLNAWLTGEVIFIVASVAGYRGLPLGRRIRLTQVRPGSGTLELGLPMPALVFTRIAP